MRIRQYVSERFSGTVAISPPIVSAYYLQAPNRGREFSFREAVLPLVYRVREDGLQTANASATDSDAWQHLRINTGRTRRTYFGSFSVGLQSVQKMGWKDKHGK